MTEVVAVALITSVPTSLTACALVITSLRTNRKVDAVAVQVEAVKKEVVTLNESTLGQLGAATETRRIHEKEETGEQITDKEQRHIDAAPMEDGA